MKKTYLIPVGIGAGILVFYFLLKQAKAAPTVGYLPSGFVEKVARHYNPSISSSDASQIASSVARWTKKRNVNAFTVLAIIAQESHFRNNATGGAGERGLMQVSKVALDELKRVYDVSYNRDRLYEIDYNIMVGTHFYLYCVERAKGKRFEAVARYNKTTRWWEAKDYASQVLAERAKIIKMYEEFKK